MCREVLRPQHYVIGYNLNLPLIWLFCPTNNNLPLKICCENIVDIAFLLYVCICPFASIENKWITTLIIYWLLKKRIPCKKTYLINIRVIWQQRFLFRFASWIFSRNWRSSTITLQTETFKIKSIRMVEKIQILRTILKQIAHAGNWLLHFLYKQYPKQTSLEQ